MKPKRVWEFDYHDFDSMSIDDMNQLIARITEARDKRAERNRRLQEAEDYLCKLYDLMSIIQSDNYNIYINGEPLSNSFDVDVVPEE